MITVNDVRNGVSTALDERFLDIPNVGEEVSIPNAAPYFLVRLHSVSQEGEMGSRYKRSHHFEIQYVPASEANANEEMHTVAEHLYDVMEYVEAAGSLLRGINLRHEIIEGILHYYADYVFQIKRQKPDVTKMTKLNQEAVLNG